MRISFGFCLEKLVFPLQQHFECGETPAGTRERRAKRFMHRVSYMIPALVFITLVCSRVNEQDAFSTNVLHFPPKLKARFAFILTGSYFPRELL